MSPVEVRGDGAHPAAGRQRGRALPASGRSPGDRWPPCSRPISSRSGATTSRWCCASCTTRGRAREPPSPRRPGLNKATVSRAPACRPRPGARARCGGGRRRGRPGTLIELDGRHVAALGLELNVDFITAVAIDLGGRIVFQRTRPIDARRPAIELLRDAVVDGAPDGASGRRHMRCDRRRHGSRARPRRRGRRRHHVRARPALAGH